jgi:hypothetical protein
MEGSSESSEGAKESSEVTDYEVLDCHTRRVEEDLKKAKKLRDSMSAQLAGSS